MKLQWLKKHYGIYKVETSNLGTLDWSQNEFLNVTVTKDEVSLVCPVGSCSNYENKEEAYAAFKVEGILDFSLVGILSDISKVLANANISIFVISTFDTDYVMVPFEAKKYAEAALKRANYQF